MESISFFYGAGIENVLLLSVGTINLVFSVLVYFTDRHKHKNILFSLFGICVSIWSFSNVMFNLTSDEFLYKLAVNGLYISASGIAVFFLFLSASLKSGLVELPLWKKIIISFFFIVVVCLVLIPDFIVIIPKFRSIKELGIGPGYLLYCAYIIVYFSSALIILVREYLNASNILMKKQALFLFIGAFIVAVIGVTINLILPFFGYWSLFWIGPVATVIIVFFVGYSTIRHNLFNTKSIVVEAVTFILWVAMLMRLILSGNPTDFAVNGVLFAVIVGGGLILINAIYKEIDQLQKIEKIASDLEVANEHLRALDKQKSEFVSIASHQLRTPLTAITGYSSMVLEGTYGPVSDKVAEVIQKVYESSRRLAVIIDDFLTISHIEQGKMTYKFETVEMNSVVKSLLDDFTPRAKDKNLFLNFTTDGYDVYNVTADIGKIRQVLSNIIDNSMKYTNSGGIDIRLTKDFALRKTRIMIKDTGIGLSRESISALFQKFSRAKEVQKVYTDGSGIGLYIGQEMIKAHHGRVWVESEGEGKGSTFFVELLSED